MQASIDKVNQLKEEGKIEVHTKYQLDLVNGNEKVESINIKHDDDSIKKLKLIMFWAFWTNYEAWTNY
jgi:thioredoxin reductase (NADPH)